MTKKMFLISIVWLIIYFLSKTLIEIYIPFSKSLTIIKNFFYINPTHNTGAAWGFLSEYPIIIIITTFIAMIIIYRYMFAFKKNKRNTLAFSLLFGGIVGNLLDRILYGYVRDFLSIYIFKYSFPVFNIADIGICIGIVLLIIAIIKGEDRYGNKSSGK